MLRSSVESDFYHALLKLGLDMDAPLEGLHTETGPGVLEAAIEYTDALAAADRAVHLQDLLEGAGPAAGQDADLHGQVVECLSRPVGPSASVAARTRSGKPAFHEAGKPGGMSDTMRWFVGGQQALMPDLLAMVASTVNSYSRLIPGFWAPTDATWGIENRTCALRVIPGSPKSQRVEYRVAAADINPYLAIAAALGSGLWGIENRIEPDAPIAGNAYEVNHAPERALAAQPSAGGGPAGGVRAGSRAVRRRLRRALCDEPRGGRSASSSAPSPIGNSHAISRSSRCRTAVSDGGSLNDIVCISPSTAAKWRGAGRERGRDRRRLWPRPRRAATASGPPCRSPSARPRWPTSSPPCWRMNDDMVPELAMQMGRPVRYGGEMRGFEERAARR